MSDLYDPREQWASYLINAIKAKEFHTKDVNYIVRKGEASLSTFSLDNGPQFVVKIFIQITFGFIAKYSGLKHVVGFAVLMLIAAIILRGA